MIDKTKKLKLQDKELGLHSLAPNKIKDNIQYPEPFHGKSGENVFKFCKSFVEALEADQVRKSDQVKMLLKYLKGEAKIAIGEHYKNVDDALKALSDAFGSSRMIMDKLVSNYEKNLGSIKQWGKHGTQERVNAINKTLDMIRHLETLADDHKTELHNEVYSQRTLQLLTKGMPTDFTKRLNELCSRKDPYEEWMARIFDILENNKEANMSALATGIGCAKIFKPEDNRDRERSSNNLKHDGHDCKRSKFCKTDWNLVGCIEL